MCELADISVPILPPTPREDAGGLVNYDLFNPSLSSTSNTTLFTDKIGVLILHL